METPDIGVIFPSRGLCFSETLNELLDELKGVKHTIYWSHGNSLPDCFNKPLERALNASHSHIWIVEDDMVLKPGILKEMINHNAQIVASDYPLAETPSGTVYYDNHGRALFSGTGCILIQTQVLKQMNQPIFRSDIKWQFKTFDNAIKFIPEKTDSTKVYGFHDVNFGIYHYINGDGITITDTVLAQRRLRKKGERKDNKGQDEIYIIDKHAKQYANNAPPEYPIPEGNLHLVILDGQEVWVPKTTLDKMDNILRHSISIKDLIIDTKDEEIKQWLNLY